MCQQLGDPPELFPVLWNLTFFNRIRGNLELVREQLATLARQADLSKQPPFLVAVAHLTGVTAEFSGEFEESTRHLERARELHVPAQHEAYTAMFGIDAGMVARAMSARPLWALGYPDRALARSAETIALCRSQREPVTMVFALIVAQGVHLYRGETREAIALGDEIIALCREYEFPQEAEWARGFQASAMAVEGRTAEGAAQGGEALAALHALRSGLTRTMFLSLNADALRRDGPRRRGAGRRRRGVRLRRADHRARVRGRAAPGARRAAAAPGGRGGRGGEPADGARRGAAAAGAVAGAARGDLARAAAAVIRQNARRAGGARAGATTGSPKVRTRRISSRHGHSCPGLDKRPQWISSASFRPNSKTSPISWPASSPCRRASPRQQKRPLGRGTHTKGVCVRATLEIFDVAKTVGDAGLAARLGRGLFAKPGVYQATVRFANAASTIQADSKRDVRALSFAVDVPAGVVGPDATRLDYSMNNAPTFPINDAHAFAAFMRVQGADGFLGHLKALLSLSFKDLKGFFQTARRGMRQQRTTPIPYQQTRFWSNVPFLHGPDEAVKYSAIPAPDNAGQPVGKGPTVLRDELLRHLNQDTEQARFDVAIQLLDTARMTVGGQKKDAPFWVESASVDWPEDQAPFTVVGRLTLQPKSQLSDAECEAWYIDVTKYSLPDHRPLGSINRARWVAESASRKARLGAGTVAPAASPSLAHRLGAIRVGSIVKALAIAAGVLALAVLGVAVFVIVRTDSGAGMLPEEKYDRVVYPDQGWGPGLQAAARQAYYYTPQGASMKDVRYSWFKYLEMPWSTRKISDPDQMRRYGFIVDPATPQNPDGFPIGFAKHYDPQLNEEVLDITCAACHTGQIHVTDSSGRTTALRIDGGSALHAFTNSKIGHFVPTFGASLMGTLANPMKFNRFANAVLGPNREGGRWALRRQMLAVGMQFGNTILTEKLHGLAPVEEGWGRIDALTRIANMVFGDHIAADNYAVGDAPVNFPPVWNIWKFDWVQYNASVSQPMARNIGESMGTGAKYALLDRYGSPLPREQRFRSSALVENLYNIELDLWKLQPPVWNEQVLGRVDQGLAAKGKLLFDQHCVSCHGPHIAPADIRLRDSPGRKPDEPEWLVKLLCFDDIGTDPNTAVGFANSKVDLRKTGLTNEDLIAVARPELAVWYGREKTRLTSEIARLQGTPGSDAQVATLQKTLSGLDARMAQDLSDINAGQLPVGAALSYLGIMVRKKAYEDLKYSEEQQKERDGFDIRDLPQVVAGYKPRPLGGIWATAPFLHNGSVPTVYDLLSPVDQRPRTFRVGSREYDTEHLGLKLPQSGYWEFNTELKGNLNTGHEFNVGYKEWKEGDPPARGLIGPLLSKDDRLAIIEHLKVRNDDTDGPKEPHVPWSATADTCKAPPPKDTKKVIVR